MNSAIKLYTETLGAKVLDMEDPLLDVFISEYSGPFFSNLLV